MRGPGIGYSAWRQACTNEACLCTSTCGIGAHSAANWGLSTGFDGWRPALGRRLWCSALGHRCTSSVGAATFLNLPARAWPLSRCSWLTGFTALSSTTTAGCGLPLAMARRQTSVCHDLSPTNVTLTAAPAKKASCWMTLPLARCKARCRQARRRHRQRYPLVWLTCRRLLPEQRCPRWPPKGSGPPTTWPKPPTSTPCCAAIIGANARPSALPRATLMNWRAG